MNMMKSFKVQIIVLILTIIANIAAFGQANPPSNKEEWIAFSFAGVAALATHIANFLMGRSKENGVK